MTFDGPWESAAREARVFISVPVVPGSYYIRPWRTPSPASGPELPVRRNRERFPDLHPALDRQSAVTEANRCLNCFDAPCADACPTHIDVPGFIKKIASGNVRGSARTILQANVLGMSSRACPVEVLCEGACVMHHTNKKPIEISRLQRFAMEDFFDHGRMPQTAPLLHAEWVACIGGGPASLACAASCAPVASPSR